MRRRPTHPHAVSGTRLPRPKSDSSNDGNEWKIRPPQVVGHRVPEARSYPHRPLPTAASRLVALGLSKGPFKGKFPPLMEYPPPLPPVVPPQPQPSSQQPLSQVLLEENSRYSSLSSSKSTSRQRNDSIPSSASISKQSFKPIVNEDKIKQLQSKVQGLEMELDAIHNNHNAASKQALLFDVHAPTREDRIGRRVKQAESEAERLRELVHSCKLDKESAERRAIRLTQRLDQLEGVLEENDRVKDQFVELRDRYQDAVEELKTLKEQRKDGREGRGDYLPRATGMGLHIQCPLCLKNCEENKELTSRNKILSKKNKDVEQNFKELTNQWRSFQRKFLDSLEIPDEVVSRSISEGGIGESVGKCKAAHLHPFLLRAINKLKTEHKQSKADLSDIQLKYEQEMVKTETLEQEVENLHTERERALEGFRQHENQILHLTNEIKALQTYCNDEVGKEVEEKVKSLMIANQNLEKEFERFKEEKLKELCELKLDIQVEKDRGNHLLSSGITEREEIEDRWKRLWSEHTANVQLQIKTLKASFENPLKSSHVRELRLQQELHDASACHERSKLAWEEYRTTLFDQLEEWKHRCQQKCELLENVRQSKIEMEIIMQKRLKELEHCQFMLNRGVEERLELQKKVEALQHQLKRFMTSRQNQNHSDDDDDDETTGRESSINLSNPALLGENKSWFILNDFKVLKEKMLSELNTPKPSPKSNKIVRELDENGNPKGIVHQSDHEIRNLTALPETPPSTSSSGRRSHRPSPKSSPYYRNSFMYRRR